MTFDTRNALFYSKVTTELTHRSIALILKRSVLIIDSAHYCVILYSGTLYYKVERSKMENLTEILKGILEGCVLEIISREETYGYEIVKKLNLLGFEDVVEGTVYTILLRLERNKLVNIQKKPSEIGPPRKFYSLNVAGQAELGAFWNRWDFVSSKIVELRRNSDVQ